jgi:uncharacterized membrane protein
MSVTNVIKIKLSPQQAAALSKQLRLGEGSFLPLRRWVVGFSLAGASSMGLITLYQVGILKHLPEPPLPHLNADKVDASAEAYALFELPDGILGLGSYAATMALAAMGWQDRVTERPWLPLALAAKVAFDLFQAGRLTLNQANRQHAFCIWCLLVAASTALTVPLVIPEAYAALRRLLGKTS